MKKNIILLLPVIAMMMACGPSREKRISQIDNLEKRLYSQQVEGYSKQKADSLLSLYEAFVKENPKDSLSPGYLFKAANIAMNGGDGQRALGMFDKYMQDYPDKPKASLCLFFKGFIYENLMQNLDKARETYLLFIEKYPNDEFVKDARMSIQNLGKTPEMLIKEFEARQHADSARIADSLAKITSKAPRRK